MTVVRTYIVYRHGSNAANQSRRLVKVLGTVAATSEEDARRRAALRWTCYNNQHFEVISTSGRFRKADLEEAYRQDTVPC